MQVLLLLVGLVSSFVGALVGAGGAFLALPALVVGFGYAPVEAAPVTLVMAAAAATSAAITCARRGTIDYEVACWMAPPAVVGAWIGAHIGSALPTEQFAIGFGVLLVLVGSWVALGRQSASPDGNVRLAAAGGIPRRRWPWSPSKLLRRFTLPTCGGLIGCLASAFGIGGGTLLMPALTFIEQMPVHLAASTSQAILAAAAVSGVVGYVQVGPVQWHAAIMISAGALVGSPLGVAVAPFISSKRLLQLLGMSMAVVGGRLLLR